MKLKQLIGEVFDKSVLDKAVQNFELSAEEQQRALQQIKAQKAEFDKEQDEREKEEKRKQAEELKNKQLQMKNQKLDALNQRQGVGTVKKIGDKPPFKGTEGTST